MKMEHVAMYVRNLESMRAFYTQWFGAVSNEGYHNGKTGLRTYFLSFEGGARLELMSRPSLAEQDSRSERYGYTHLAFQVNGRKQVDQLTEDLAAAGYEVVSGPRVSGDGYYESCILDPEGNRVEIIG